MALIRKPYRPHTLTSATAAAGAEVPREGRGDHEAPQPLREVPEGRRAGWGKGGGGWVLRGCGGRDGEGVAKEGRGRGAAGVLREAEVKELHRNRGKVRGQSHRRGALGLWDHKPRCVIKPHLQKPTKRGSVWDASSKAD